MKTLCLLCLALLSAPLLAGCQSSQSRQAQLAAICADPANRQPKTFYYSECQTLYPSSDQALQKDYLQGAPAGD